MRRKAGGVITVTSATARCHYHSQEARRRALDSDYVAGHAIGAEKRRDHDPPLQLAGGHVAYRIAKPRR
jgi:hypothetical protein